MLRKKVVAILIIVQCLFFLTGGAFGVAIKQVQAADQIEVQDAQVSQHPYFYNMNEMKDRINTYDWAKTIQQNIINNAKVWLTRNPPKFEADSLQYGYIGGLTCPQTSTGMKYEYADTAPTSFFCDDADGGHWVTESDFTPNSPLTWNEPGSGVVRAWNAKKLNEMISGMSTLALAYQLTEDTDPNKNRYADIAADMLKDLANKYPGYTIHDRLGGGALITDPTDPKYGTIKSTTSNAGFIAAQWLDEANYMQQLVHTYDLLYDSGRFTEDDRKKIEILFKTEVMALPVSEHGIQALDNKSVIRPGGGNNWSLASLAAKSAVAYLFDIESLKGYVRTNYEKFLTNPKFILSDGFWFEGTLNYHNISLSEILNTADFAYRRGLVGEHEDLYHGEGLTNGSLAAANLRKMFEIIPNILYPNGQNQRNNDNANQNGDSLFFTSMVSTNLEAGHTLFPDSAIINQGLYVLYNTPGKDIYRDISGVRALEMGSPIKPAKYLELSDADYEGAGMFRIVDKSDANDIRVATLDKAIHGAQHGHYDKLNVTLFGEGRIWGEDPGTANYGSPLGDAYYKRTIAHNTVTLSTYNQLPAEGKTLLLGSGDKLRVLSAEAPDALPNMTQFKRTLAMADGLILDLFRVADKKPTRAKTYIATDSASVRDGSGTSKGASIPIRDARSSTLDSIAYFKFDLTPQNDTSFDSVKIRFTAFSTDTQPEKFVNMKLYGIEQTDWTENTINWDNSPNHVPDDTTVTNVGTSATYLGMYKGLDSLSRSKTTMEFDITDYVRSKIQSGQKIVAFMMVDDQNNSRIIQVSTEHEPTVEYQPTIMVSYPKQADAVNQTSYDWIFHNLNATLSVDGLDMSPGESTLGTDNGYEYVDIQSKGTTQNQWSATFTSDTDATLHHKITMLPTVSQSVYNVLTLGDGRSPTVKMPAVIARVTSPDETPIDFMAVHEIFKDASQIASITRSDSEIHVLRTDGTSDVIGFNIDAQQYYLIKKDSSGKVIREEMVGYKGLTLSGVTYLTTQAGATGISAAWKDRTLAVVEPGVTDDELQVYVGDNPIDSVTLNGLRVLQFERNGSYITFTNTSSNVEQPRPDHVALTGESLFEIPADGRTTAPYSATIIDQYGREMNAESVAFALYGAPEGVTISDSGLLSIASTADVGRFTVRATSLTNPALFAELPVTVQDTTPPVTTAEVSGTKGNGDWYVSPVTLALSSESQAVIMYSMDEGVTWSVYQNPVTIDTDGVHHILYRATDRHGNVETAKSLSLSIDTTPPNITVGATTYANDNGWYNHDIIVGFQCSDLTSGIVSCPSPVTITDEGTGLHTSGIAKDAAGNQAEAAIDHLQLDKTAPVLTIQGDGVYTIDQQVLVSCSAVDNLSGIATSSCSEPLVSGPASLMAPGDHSVTASVYDKADNVTTGTATFTVVVTYDSLIKVTDRFMSDYGSPGNQGNAHSLSAKLEQAQAADKRGDSATKQNILNAYQQEVSALSGKKLTEKQADQLARFSSSL